MDHYTTCSLNCNLEHQPRERAVTCTKCLKRQTWHLNPVCDHCKTTQETT